MELATTLPLKDPIQAANTDANVELMRQELLNKAAYLPPDKLEFVITALQHAQKWHAGQKRRSGEPYIIHPIATALYLAGLRLDAVSLAAALLHDVLEDCNVQSATLRELFGDEVTNIVEGVTKLTHMEDKRPEQTYPKPNNSTSIEIESYGAHRKGERPQVSSIRNAATLRRILVATVSDVRVMLIKLADRLHNVSTLSHMPEHKQKLIAQETLKIYAPLAHRLGVYDLKWQLEDNSFKYNEPSKYKTLSKLVNRKRAEREVYTEDLMARLKERVALTGLKCEIYGRPKHLYSVYRKLNEYRRRGRHFNDIHDLIALRVITESRDACYQILGLVHGLWQPINGSFDDYVARPKGNGYQSLHTAVIGEDGHPFEVQIRTHEMHSISERGVAAHWSYKEGASHPQQQDAGFETRMKWLHSILNGLRELQGEASADDEYVESVQSDILSTRVFVYTPKGDVVDLPVGATALDFAYAVHTELGNSCAGVIVNGKMLPLATKLQNGDTVEVRKSRTARPSLDWLNPNLQYFAAAATRYKIRAWFKRQLRPTRIEKGKLQLQRELQRFNLKLSSKEVLKSFDYTSLDDLAEAIGSGRLSLEKISEILATNTVEVTRFTPTSTPTTKTTKHKPSNPAGIVVMGKDNIFTRLPKCCGPSYGDEIVGYLTVGGGVTIHRQDCINVPNLKDTDRFVSVAWGHSGEARPVRITVSAVDRIGLINDITRVIREASANIHSLISQEKSDTHACTVSLTVYTINASQLGKVLVRLGQVAGVQHARVVGLANNTKEEFVDAQ